jgi:hypothetical protein
MFARGARVTVRSHAGQESKGVVVCRVDAADVALRGSGFTAPDVGESVKDQGAYLVRTSSGRRVVSSAQLKLRQ